VLTIFTQPDCPICDELKAALAAIGMGYTEVQVTTVDGMAEYADERMETNALPLLKNIDGRLFEGQAAVDFVRTTMTRKD